MTLHPKLVEEIQRIRENLRLSGALISPDRLDGYYALFREKFGPERLAGLDGEALLTTMHDFGEDPDRGMVYWLEFKNDEEFPTGEFGSIKGGSALKFGLWRRKEDGVWVTGKSTQSLREISVDEAVTIARRHRDQLLQGVRLLESLSGNAGHDDYLKLQQGLNEHAPDIVDTIWAHKYFHLLSPDKLDDFHAESIGRFHLIKLLQTPPEQPGRFLAAQQYVTIAGELGMPMNHLTKVLNERDGGPHDYWRIGTRVGGKDDIWPMMLEASEVAIGWSALGDLSGLVRDQDSKQKLRALLAMHSPDMDSVISRKTQEIFNFVTRIADGDMVLAADGKRIRGIGRVTGPYRYEPGDDRAPHRRPVEWLHLNEWSLPQQEGLQTTVFPIRKYVANHLEVERRLLEGDEPPTIQRPLTRLTGELERIQTVLERKKLVILYGPPGTGKTYWARLAAQELAARSRHKRPFSALSPDEQQSLAKPGEHDGGSAIWMCTFHPAYGYEDFLEGYRPHAQGDQLVFELRDGIFKRLCQAAERNPDHNYYLIIDEINRGDIPRIFGELLTLLEKDKRNLAVSLPLSGDPFTVPPNVYLIATMNTADRSIALLDTALRRRFGFVELMPDKTVLRDTVIANSIPLGEWLAGLNRRVLQHIGRDARNLQVGHAYFLEGGQPVTKLDSFARIVRDDIIPLLQEYCYEDYGTLAQLLGESLVDVQGQRIRFELFAPNREDELIQALLEPEPDLAASKVVVDSDASAQALEAEEEAAEARAEEE
jgi:5-methylcytosine-specific restriction protein B